VGGNYQYDYKLQHEDTTLLKYNFVIFSNEEWSETEITNVDLKVTSSNGENDGPGFELVFVFIAAILTLFIIKRKRVK